MADRTIRAVLEATVTKAQKGMRDLAGDVDKTGAKVDGLAKDLKSLSSVQAKPKIDLAIEDAQRRLTAVTKELGELRQLKATPEVELQIKEAQKRLRDVRTELKDLQNAKATIPVKADTGQAEKEIASLGKSGVGKSAGDAVGGDMVSGIISALGSIPIAGAVIGAGAAIAGGILLGIKQGLQIEVERDLFGARTGLDEATAAKFGRAAGEAYAGAWGESVAANLETARTAMEQGLLSPESTEKDAERVITSLTGIAEIMQTDIPETARAAGQMIKTGLADSAERAFDILVAGYQHGAGASQDLTDTLTEYPVLFQRLGLSGEDAMGLLIQGLKGGAFNADKTADALKEFQIRATDASESSAEGFRLIGLNAEEMTAKIAKGGPDARAGLQEVLDGLNAIEDPVKRNTAGVALFGTQWEDMGDAIRNLDLKTAASELGDAAGAAERALEMMSDNTASKIESARRNIEVAADGIKGALAEAFSDEISGAAEWVSKNRAPLMQFFLDVINGALDAGKAFVEFSAQSLTGVAALAEGLANVIQFIPGMSDAADSLRGFADSARTGAETLRTEVPAALDETRDKINAWAGPEIMAARVHDATMAMTAEMDAFSAAVNASGGTVTINGDTVNADQALEVLLANINAEDGTVTINGDKVPAAEALATVLAEIAAGSENVTIGGDAKPAWAELDAARAAVRAAEDNITINGETAKAQAQLESARARVRAAEESIRVNADTASAQRRLDDLVRYRVAEIGIRIAGITGVGGQTRHDGGWIGKGLNAGGWVPGRDPGYDNILWPLNRGGQTLAQPLTGSEYVVNAKDAAFWGPALQWMNGGGRPSAAPSSLTGLAITGVLETPFGPAQVRGVVQSELAGVAARMRMQGARG